MMLMRSWPNLKVIELLTRPAGDHPPQFQKDFTDQRRALNTDVKMQHGFSAESPSPTTKERQSVAAIHSCSSVSSVFGNQRF